MGRLLNAELIERLLFTAIVAGIFMVAGAGFRYLDLSNQLTGNMAAKIHESGGEVELESKSEAHGLMAADIQRRRITSEQYNMMVIGGAGLGAAGLGLAGLRHHARSAAQGEVGKCRAKCGVRPS